jgi:hypothetical protein
MSSPKRARPAYLAVLGAALLAAALALMAGPGRPGAAAHHPPRPAATALP